MTPEDAIYYMSLVNLGLGVNHSPGPGDSSPEHREGEPGHDQQAAEPEGRHGMMFDREHYRIYRKVHGGRFIPWTLAIHPMLWYGGAVLLSLIMIVLVVVLSPARAEGRSYPTYIETEKDKEKRIADRRISIAYSCGYLEAATNSVDPICEEYRETASRHGFRPGVAPR